MGATKRLAELVLQVMAQEFKRHTFYHGWIWECTGLIWFGYFPVSRADKNCGPVTATHRKITRYFMIITKTAQLVIQAGALGEGGDVFVLEMCGSIKMNDLARSIIRLSGLDICDVENVEGDIKIEYTGLRSGENSMKSC